MPPRHAAATDHRSVGTRHWGDGAGAESAPATGGFSWYTRIMDWVQEPYSIESLSLGMGATWMQRVTNDPNTSCACPLDKTTGLCGSGAHDLPRHRSLRVECCWVAGLPSESAITDEQGTRAHRGRSSTAGTRAATG